MFVCVNEMAIQLTSFSVCKYCLQKTKGTKGVIQIENPNLAKPKNLKARDADVSYSTKYLIA